MKSTSRLQAHCRPIAHLSNSYFVKFKDRYKHVGKAQVSPPGMNLIYLPFADDIRSPETDTGFLGPEPYPEPDEEQLATAGKLLKKLHLHEFQPGMVPNPHLQRHYQVNTQMASHMPCSLLCWQFIFQPLHSAQALNRKNVFASQS